MPYELDQKFWDPAALNKDALRVFEICNGCRRCFNLCPSFDLLFRKIDDEVDGDVEKLKPDTLEQTADVCYYCKLCFNHCPYCPPHQYALDFPRLMVQQKMQRAKEQPYSLRDRLLVRTELIGKLGGMVAPLANWANGQGWFRWLMEKAAGIHRRRILPRFYSESFSSWFGKTTAPTEGTEKVVLFYTCYVNHHDPGIGRASVEVLKKNNVAVVCPEQECCGMPYFDTGEIDKIIEKAKANVARLLPFVKRGYKIVVPMPTCSLMLKKEYPELLNNEEARAVSAATLDLSEYLMRLEGAGKLSKNFKAMKQKVLYQVPCHLRDQNIGYKARDLMALIPGVEVQVIERCSGHDGSFGVKTEYFDLSMAIGKKAFSAVEAGEPDRVVSDCPLSALQMMQGTGKPAAHPIELVNEAYGEKP